MWRNVPRTSRLGTGGRRVADDPDRDPGYRDSAPAAQLGDVSGPRYRATLNDGQPPTRRPIGEDHPPTHSAYPTVAADRHGAEFPRSGSSREGRGQRPEASRPAHCADKRRAREGRRRRGSPALSSVSSTRGSRQRRRTRPRALPFRASADHSRGGRETGAAGARPAGGQHALDASRLTGVERIQIGWRRVRTAPWRDRRPRW